MMVELATCGRAIVVLAVVSLLLLWSKLWCGLLRWRLLVSCYYCAAVALLQWWQLIISFDCYYNIQRLSQDDDSSE